MKVKRADLPAPRSLPKSKITPAAAAKIRRKAERILDRGEAA